VCACYELCGECHEIMYDNRTWVGSGEDPPSLWRVAKERENRQSLLITLSKLEPAPQNSFPQDQDITPGKSVTPERSASA
jgi:hypothetical protein